MRGKKHKEKQHIRQDELSKLQDCMNKELLDKTEAFKMHSTNKDNDAYWASWSEAVEKGCLKYLGHKGSIKKALAGRGKTMILNKTPGRTRRSKKENEFKHLRSQASRKALESLRQARRCEQYVFRLEMKARKEATAVHRKLNQDASRCIIKAAEEGDDWQDDLVILLSKPENKGGENTMIIPALKRAAGKYHNLFETRREEAVKENQVEQQVLYKIKGKGQWTLAKHMGGKTLPPLTAVKRVKKGEKGEAVGTIATRTKEVDKIVREAYNAVYQGNKKDIEEATEHYLKEYENYIYI